MLTKFCEPALSGCGVIWKMGENAAIVLSGPFFNAFL